jgi:hypothetical protein
MVLYLCVLIVFSLRWESLVLILAMNPFPRWFCHMYSTWYFPLVLKPATQKEKMDWNSSTCSSTLRVAPVTVLVVLWSLPLLYFIESHPSLWRHYLCNNYSLYSWHLVICEHFWSYVCNNWSWVMHTMSTWFWHKTGCDNGLTRFRTKARVNFTWSVKHPMWSWSLAGSTIASAPCLARLGKWWCYERAICWSASCYRTTNTSRAASLMPALNVHLGAGASTTWRMRWIWSVIGLS